MNKIVCLLFLVCISLLQGQTDAELEVLATFSHERDVVFKNVEGDNFVIDMVLFFPEESKRKPNAPWTLFVHGGGWAGGNKWVIFKAPFLGTLRTLLDSGVVVASVEYRRSRSGISAAFESVVDCKDAARYLIKNANQYGLNTERYAVWGGSAGGHLSLLTALGANDDFQGDPDLSTFSPEFSAVASYYPATTLLNPDVIAGSILETPATMARIIVGTVEEEPELAKLLSPTEHLTSSSPPILLLHGDNDQTLPISNSLYMMEVAQEIGADVQLLTVENGGHSFGGNNISPTMEAINDSSASYMLAYLFPRITSIHNSPFRTPLNENIFGVDIK